jgi:hypothetical protein
MNTQQIEQSESNVLPFNIDNLTSLDVAEISRVVAAKEAEEHNDIVDFVEQTKNENAFLRLQVSNLSNRLDGVIDENEKLVAARKRDEAKEKDFEKKAQMISDNAKMHMQMLEQAKREKAQIEIKLNDAILTVASYKEIGSPKKIRDQRKDYQERIAKHLAGEKQHKLEIKKYRHSIVKAEEAIKEITHRLREVDMTEAYNQNGDHLWLFPKVMQITNRGMADKEICFLYLNDDGRGCLMTLDEDGEIVLGKAPIRPKADTKAHAGMLLRKFKKNGWTVQVDDLQVIGG